MPPRNQIDCGLISLAAKDLSPVNNLELVWMRDRIHHAVEQVVGTGSLCHQLGYVVHQYQL